MFRLESADEMEGRNHPTSTIPSMEGIPHPMGQGLGSRGLFRSDAHVFSVPYFNPSTTPNQSHNYGSWSSNIAPRSLVDCLTASVPESWAQAAGMAACSHALSSKLCGELQCHSTWPHTTPRGHELSAFWRFRGRLGLISEFLIRCSGPNRAARLRVYVGFHRLRNQCTGSMYLHLWYLEAIIISIGLSQPRDSSSVF